MPSPSIAYFCDYLHPPFHTHILFFLNPIPFTPPKMPPPRESGVNCLANGWFYLEYVWWR
jgi:hypothetical protein